MELLKVGDKVCNMKHPQFSSFVRYEFSEVVRLTKTQAILDNRERLINKPEKNYFDKYIGYPVYGRDYDRWHLVIPEILQDEENEKKRKSILTWFDNNRFSEEEKFLIYSTFKELGKLKSEEEK